jgi:hypothetical protein
MTAFFCSRLGAVCNMQELAVFGASHMSFRSM